MTYRPELDGLRAVAVLAVVLFHLGVPGVQGGYVGVDVFFTLSGYLITGLILTKLQRGEFGLGDFYARRIRRLFPAALTVTALTALAALFVVPQTTIVSLGNSVIASALSCANFFFWSESGYFDESTDYKPLLHMWSLGVEEQFYLVWPTVLLLVFRWSRGRRGLLLLVPAIIGALSFAATLVSMRQHSESAFYLPHFRAWEFALGACLRAAEPPLDSDEDKRLDSFRPLSLLLGLVLIVGAMVAYNEDSTFPGILAVPPCLGTALVIFGQGRGFGGRALDNRVSVFLGKISYSVYLVHWPLICLYRFDTLRTFSLVEKFVLFSLTLVAATALYYFVENPLRRPRSGRGLEKGRFAFVALGFALVLGAAGYRIRSAGGVDREVTRSSAQILDYLAEANRAANELTRREVCYMTKTGAVDYEKCLAPHPGLPNVLVIGDSHAANWYPGLVEHYAGRAHVSVSAVMNCRPLLFSTSDYPACQSRNADLFEKMDLSVYDVVYLVGGFYKKKEWQALPAALERLKERGAKRLTVLGAPMSYKPSVPVILSKYAGEDAQVALARLNERILDRFFDSDEPVREACDKAGVGYLSLVELLCPDKERSSCLHAIPGEGMPFVRDSRHLSKEGALWIFSQWKATGKTL